MNIGSSAASIFLATSNEEAIDILAEAGVDSADFWLYLCSLNESAPMQQPDWEIWAEGIRRKMDSVHLPVAQSHALFNIFIPEDFSFVSPQEIIFRNIRACAILGCKELIFHPLELLQTVTDEEVHQRILEYNLRWFQQLLPLAEELAVEIHIENMFVFSNKQQVIPFAFTSSSDVCWLVDKLQHPLVKVCLDTGHASICGLDIPQTIREIGHRLGSLHLNDNFGKISPIRPDLHLLPGHGQIDWIQVMHALREIGYKGVLNMEPVDSLPRLTHPLMVHQLASAADFLRKTAQGCGMG